MRKDLLFALNEVDGNLYWNTSMILDIICEKLIYECGYNNVYFNGRSVYIDDLKVLSVRTAKECQNCIYLDDYKLFV